MQGTYETFGAVANKHFNHSLKGTLSVTAGLGGMGGAQPLSVTMNGGVCLAAEVEKWRIEKRIETKYLDEMVLDIDESIDKALKAKEEGKAWSIGVHCNAVDLLQRLTDREIKVDILTDQTSAHDPLIGYVPHGISLEEANALRKSDPEKYIELSYASMKRHVPISVRFSAKERDHFAGLP